MKTKNSIRSRGVAGAPAWPRSYIGLAAVILLALAFSREAAANPTGMTVVQGTATAANNGPHLLVTASQNAYLSWQSFNIGAGQTTTFVQPSASSVVWNQINGVAPSQIWGSLNANGVVVLMNSSGFFFGPNSEVKAAGFV